MFPSLGFPMHFHNFRILNKEFFCNPFNRIHLLASTHQRLGEMLIGGVEDMCLENLGKARFNPNLNGPWHSLVRPSLPNNI